MKKSDYRHEEKYLLTYAGYRYLKNLLNGVMRPDQNMGDRGEYYIRSLYFDTFDNREYVEKDSGIYERRKIRLRIYNVESDVVKLELKAKAGQGIRKESLEISREEADRLINGDCSWLPEYQKPVAGRLYRMFQNDTYHPVTIIDYEREAYILPVFSVRITFDKKVRSHMGGGGFWDPDLPMANLLDGSRVVLEVKYTDMMPEHIRRLLAVVPKVPTAFSKYCYSRRLTG